MADPASLAQRAGELARDAGALSRNLDTLSQQLALATQQGVHAGTPFVFELTVFVLAVFVGYYVVWRVTPALHSPLMSVTNAISSVIIVGALIAVGLVIGGGVGAYIARQIQMTALPQLVAAFHSLVGLAAVCVATAAFAAPEAYGIGMRGAIHPSSLIEMAIGLTIGAITFTGSVVAFAKLQGIVSGRPLLFPGQHLINLALGILLFALIVLFVMTEASSAFALLVLLSLAFGFLLS